MGKCDVAAKYAEQYSLQIQNTTRNMEQLREQQGKEASEELVTELEHNYLQQQAVLLSVLENAPETAQEGILNAIETSNKHVEKAILDQQGQEAVGQYQEQVIQQTSNMGENTQIRIRQMLQAEQGQSSDQSENATGQNVQTQQQTTQQTQQQTQQQTTQQAQQQESQQTGNQGANTGSQQGNQKQGK